MPFHPLIMYGVLYRGFSKKYYLFIYLTNLSLSHWLNDLKNNLLQLLKAKNDEVDILVNLIHGG